MGNDSKNIVNSLILLAMHHFLVFWGKFGCLTKDIMSSTRTFFFSNLLIILCGERFYLHSRSELNQYEFLIICIYELVLHFLLYMHVLLPIFSYESLMQLYFLTSSKAFPYLFRELRCI